MSVSSQSQDQTQPEDANRADAIRASGQWSVMRRLMPYLWPKDRPDLRRRVAYALVALLIAKAATVTVPFFYKWAVDTLTGVDGGSAAGPDFTVGLSLATAAVALTIGYGLARLLSSGFQQLRDGLFARVGQHAQRTVTVMTFKHMHRLSLRFHLERRTGGLSRIIERGSQAIDFLLRYTLFSIVPTLIELALVCVVLGVNFSLVYSLVTAVTMGSFIWFTFTVTEWRLKLRREMNRTDTEANTKAVDSLLNFETVKYFNNEAYEQKRFDVAAAAYEKAATKSNTSLSWPKFNQESEVLLFVAAFS
ncbi:MAG: ABC transporter transmembrane domain-containing protein [Pseudomonadota bacterium]